MDPINIIQFSLYSKIMTECVNIIEKIMTDGYVSKNMMLCIIICFLVIKQTPYQIYNYIETQIEQILYNTKDECSIIIPYHTKTYTSCGFSPKTITKTMYSERFLALNHYLKHVNDILSFTEIINFENTRYGDDYKSEYIFIPNNMNNMNKIKICSKQDIFFEIVIEKKTNDDSSDERDSNSKTKKSNKQRIQTSNYIYKISKHGKHNVNVLLEFMKSCIEKYNADISEKKVQMIYEYMKTSMDDNDSLCMSFESSPFKSNKTFDNIFFEGKKELQEDIQEFVMNMDDNKKRQIEAEYKRKGIPYKRTYLLHGPPGTGKTSLIKAFANETGRHCILVQWSKIKTSTEFSNIFHGIKINNEKLSQKEMIIVFEDFDANNSSAIKIRNNLQNNEDEKHIENIRNTEQTQQCDNQENIIKKTLETMLIGSQTTMTRSTDTLTLECILNVLDGIKELNDIVIVFTTNDLHSIDPAVIRPGRVDKIIKMDKVSSSIIKEIVQHYYNDYETDKITELDKLKYTIAPSIVQEICIKNNTIVSCIDQLISM